MIDPMTHRTMCERYYQVAPGILELSPIEHAYVRSSLWPETGREGGGGGVAVTKYEVKFYLNILKFISLCLVGQ